MSDIHLHRVVFLCGALVVAMAFGCRHSSDPGPGAPDRPPHPLASSGRIVVQATVVSLDQIDILVANGTKAPLEVRRNLRIEQLRDEEWFMLEGVGSIWIRDDCDPIEGVVYPTGMGVECMDLPAETVIEVEPWLGMVGDAQCACEACAPVPDGRYRVVLLDCHGGRTESEPFRLIHRDDEDQEAESVEQDAVISD